MAFDVQTYLGSLTRFGMKPGLERIQKILARLGSPERTFPAVHVGGTNGKGSIASLVAAALRVSGYRVGLYTSPHLIRYNERIQVDGLAIDDRRLAELMEHVAAVAAEVKNETGSDPTEFEVGTATAFLHFRSSAVDLAVIEVGLGGRLDSTNVVDSRVIALGPIALDHMAVLGPDVASIAKEKAGIFRPGVPVVSAPQPAGAAEVIHQAAQACGADLYTVRERETDAAPSDMATYRVGAWGLAGGEADVATPWRSYPDLRVGLVGRHQLENAAVAVTVLDALDAQGFPVKSEAVYEGIQKARWPGRLELLPGRPSILLDGVHNEGGARALAGSLERLLEGRKPVFVMAIMGERDPASVLGPILPFAQEVYFTKPRSSRTAPTETSELVRVARQLGCEAEGIDFAYDALAAACAKAGPDGLVCVCGSLYLVGEIHALIEEGKDPRRPDKESRIPVQ